MPWMWRYTNGRMINKCFHILFRYIRNPKDRQNTYTNSPDLFLQVTPLNDELYLPPPSPIVQPQRLTASSRLRLGQKASYKTRKKSRNGRSRSRSRITTRLKNPPNLSTIVEESSNSCASSISIDLKPTIIISNPPHCCSSGASTSQSLTPSTAQYVDMVDPDDPEPSAHSGRKLQVFPSSCRLHSSLGSTLVRFSLLKTHDFSSFLIHKYYSLGYINWLITYRLHRHLYKSRLVLRVTASPLLRPRPKWKFTSAIRKVGTLLLFPRPLNLKSRQQIKVTIQC